MENTALSSFQQGQEIDLRAFEDLFFGEGSTLSIINAEGSPQAITPQTPELAALSHLGGSSFKYRINSKGSPCGFFRQGTALLLGVSPIDLDGMVRWVGWDLDGKGHKNGCLVDVDGVTLGLVASCQERGLKAYWEVSKGGNGRHVWVFFENLITAAEARALGLFLAPKDAAVFGGGVADPYKNKAVEIFPKQTTKGLGGNPLWLPGWVGAQPGRCQLHNELGQPVRFSEVTKSNPVAVDSVVKLAMGKALALRAAEASRQMVARAPIKDLQVIGFDAKEGAQEEVAKICRSIAKKKNRAGVFGQFCAVASWVNGGWVAEAWARAQVLAACDLNGSADKWPEYQRERWWDGALAVAEPKASLLPSLYLSQLDAAELGKAAKPLALDPARAEVKKLVEDYIITNKLGRVGLIAGDPGVGKTHAVMLASKEKPIILAVPTHELARQKEKEARELGLSVKRNFPPTSKDGLLDASGQRVCKKPLERIEAAIDAGLYGSNIFCKSCPFNKNGDCLAAKGFTGDPKANLIITTHDSLLSSKLPKVYYLVIDELKEVYKEVKLALVDLEDLAKGKGDLKKGPHKILQDAAKALLSWDGSGLPPINRAELAVLALEHENKVPRRLPRVTDQDENRGAWRAVMWLFSLASTGASVKLLAGGLGFVQPSPAALALMRGCGLVLNGTADESLAKDIETSTGASVTYHKISVAPQVAPQLVWLPTTMGARQYTVPNKKVDLAAIVPLLGRIIEDLKARPELVKVLLATHQEVKIALAGDLGVELRHIIKARAGELALIHWGGKEAEGSNKYKDFDAAYGLGDPLCGAAPCPDELTPSEEWSKSQRRAASKLAQFFERLRSVSASKAKRLVHLGCVLPLGWSKSTVSIEYIKQGRPSKPGPSLSVEGWLVALESMVKQLGFRGTLRALEVSQRTLEGWLRGDKNPEPEILAKVIGFIEQRGVLKNLLREEGQEIPNLGILSTLKVIEIIEDWQPTQPEATQPTRMVPVFGVDLGILRESTVAPFL